jgi:integrase
VHLETSVKHKIDLAAAIAAIDDQPASEMTLAELVGGFNTVTAGDYDWRLRKWLEAMGHLSAWEITSEQLECAAQAMLRHGYSPSTVNRDISALGTCYRWAKAQRLSPRGFRSPTLGVTRQSEAIRRVEISQHQLDALKARSLTVRNRAFGVFVQLLIDTGARKSELLERCWSEVDLQACTITCPTTKTGVPRILHFQPSTAELITRVFKHRPDKGLVFEGNSPHQPINFRTTWERVTEQIGLNGLHMHDLRHAAAADLLRSGVTIGVAAQVLGHSPQVLARRYGHLETATLRAAQEQRWSTQ